MGCQALVRLLISEELAALRYRRHRRRTRVLRLSNPDFDSEDLGLILR